ncbi:MAG: DUF4145 domain-containing protein [Deltaproteobacteria bacterium]|nr:DUF4145 domain-containing protein [Deltaproteobacteria bacterium]
MDRKLYKLPFRKGHLPRWVCPTCGKGTLNVNEDTFYSFETSGSRKERGRKDRDPFLIEYVYSCLLVCLNDGCRDVVVNSGEGSVDVDFDYDDNGRQEQNLVDFFRPKYFHPHLKLFLLPKGTPKDVVDEINQSFELFFCNPPSSSNHVRIALENLLTYMKVKRYETKNRKKIFLNLNKRIDLIPEKYQSLKDSCRAIKWLGNAGSHSAKKITLDDVMDAYEIMDEVLSKLFDEKQEHINKLVNTINKKKGPKGSK